MSSPNLLLTKSIIHFLAFLFLYAVIYDMSIYNFTEKGMTKLLKYLIFYTHTHARAHRKRGGEKGENVSE